MTATPPKPSLVKSTALSMAQAVTNRLDTLLPTVQSPESPVTVYQAGTSGVGRQLSAPTSAFPVGTGYYGVWTAPNLNGGKPYTVQVECFGGGGGGGGGAGGSSPTGGGGGGGAEYAAETFYPVKPGTAYVWKVGVPGSPGTANSSGNQGATAGGTGGDTVFDVAGTGVAGGVIAHGAQGGDTGNTGLGGSPGAGSFNSTVYSGGAGGTDLPGTGSSGSQGGTDNPLALYVAGLLNSPPQAWYVFNDASSTGVLNDSTGSGYTASESGVGGNRLSLAQPGAPSQVPAYAGSANLPSSPNPTAAGTQVQFPLTSPTQGAGYVLAPGFPFSGSQATISCWITPDPSGTWGNPATGARAVIAANCLGYYNSSTAGTALFLSNTGTGANPNWQLSYYCASTTVTHTITTPLVPAANTPVYVVATFNAGAMKLYVNGVLAVSGSAGFSSIPGWPTVPYGLTTGIGPQISSDWFFGFMSNLWYSDGVLSAAGVTQAFSGSGGSSTHGGAGGGASGGPVTAGGTGIAGSGSSGGAGGTPAAQPVTEIGLNTPASAGISGASGGSSNNGITGAPGAGGGGAGSSVSPPTVVTVQVPFITAASYCGTDAAGPAAGTLYNPVLQGSNGRLFTGGRASDAASGTKNSLLILPPNLAAQLKNGSYTVLRVTLTVTNANPQAPQNTLMQAGWSSDTFLPVTYQAADISGSAGVVEIPAGITTVTADLTESQLGAYLQNGGATALVLGPGSTPGFAAFNTSTAPNFYTSVYGPGAVDSAGNSLAPYLTVTYAQTTTVQQGSPGGSGAIRVTFLNQAEQLVGHWTSADGINAGGGQLTETTLVLGSTIVDAALAADRSRTPEERRTVRATRARSKALGLRPGRRLGAIPGAPGTVLGYSGSPTTVTQSTPGSYTFTVPAGVTSLNVSCNGAGAGATGGSSSQGQGGGGGGAYAGEPNYAVTPGQVLHYTVGAGGTSDHVGTSSSPNGAASVFDTTNVAGSGVTANGGQAYQSALNYGPGGTASVNTVSFPGGNGGPLIAGQANGSGGGGSAGTTGAGGGASQGGGAGLAGSGGGEPGGAGSASGNGAAGTAPGGGAGGSSKGTSSNVSGNGANGSISFTYNTTALTVAIATANGTDAAGNAYVAGVLAPKILAPSYQFNFNSASYTSATIATIIGSFAQLNFQGPASTTPGHTDFIALQWNSSDGTSGANGSLEYVDPSGGTHFHATWGSEGFNIAAGSINGVEPGTGSITTPAGVEFPHAASLINGWTGSGGGYNGLWYWVDADITASPGGTVFGQLHLAADMNPPAGVTGNSICFQLPSGWRPQTSQNVGPVGWNNPQVNNAASLPWLFVDTSGNVQITGMEVANKPIFFHLIVPMGTL